MTAVGGSSSQNLDHRSIGSLLTALSMRISVEQLNGKTLVLEVTPEMRMREVKQQIKDMHEWEDELSRDTTVVEVIFDNKKLGNDETVAQVGLSADSVLTGLFRQNIARYTNKRGFGPGGR